MIGDYLDREITDRLDRIEVADYRGELDGNEGVCVGLKRGWSAEDDDVDPGEDHREEGWD